MTATERKKEASSIQMTISIITLILVVFGYFVNYYTYLLLQYKQVGGRENYEIINKVQMQQIKQMVDYYKANPSALGANNEGNTDTGAKNEPLTKEQMSGVIANTPVLGSKEAKISWVEYSDLECPYCKKHAEGGVYQEIAKSLGDNGINYRFKHFPLSIHPGSEKKHEALECARQLAGDEVFFKLKDKVFEKNTYQEPISLDDMVALAVELGVKKDDLNTCVSSGKNKEVIDASLKEGQDMFSIDGTPATVIINNETGAYRFVSGARGLEDFKNALSEVMAN